MTVARPVRTVDGDRAHRVAEAAAKADAVDRSSESRDSHEFPAAVIEVAVGVLMEQLALDAGDARSYLLRRANAHDRSLLELAGEIVSRPGV